MVRAGAVRHDASEGTGVRGELREKRKKGEGEMRRSTHNVAHGSKMAKGVKVGTKNTSSINTAPIDSHERIDVVSRTKATIINCTKPGRNAFSSNSLLSPIAPSSNWNSCSLIFVFVSIPLPVYHFLPIPNCFFEIPNPHLLVPPLPQILHLALQGGHFTHQLEHLVI